MRLFSLLLFGFIFISGHAQIKQVPIRIEAKTSKPLQSTRMQSTSMNLPFWDDFSFNKSEFNYANDSLWQYGNAVWVNTGNGIKPPTYKVATFDGLDSLGSPYNLTNQLAKGVADKLVSQPIRMNLVSPADSIFIFFYYQYQGNGEPPDAGDEFSLWFKDNANKWRQVWVVDVDTTSDPTKFVPIKISISKLTGSNGPSDTTTYFHDNFQFRFQNFGRLSGPFDTWNLDYVYINNGKQQYAPVYADFPDRAITQPLTSIFSQYQSIPVKHLLAKRDTALSAPTITATSVRQDQTSALSAQPVDLTTNVYAVARVNKVNSTMTSSFSKLSADLIYDSAYLFQYNSIVDVNWIDPAADSVGIKVSVKLNSGDVLPKMKIRDPGDTIMPYKYDSLYVNDFDTVVYKGIEFRHNDTTSTSFHCTNYYAYDDGVAERAITLTQPGSYLAYQFDMMYSSSDTIVAIDIYFPHIGDESDQVLKLSVWDENMRLKDSVTVTVSRTSNNLFTRYQLDQVVGVKNKFYIGYKQNSYANIGVGYDKNTDSWNKLSYNVNGVWQIDSTLHGSAMIRPVFGAGHASVVTAIEPEKTYAYPNPNHGTFSLPQAIQGLQVIDITGKQINFSQEDFTDKTQVTLSGQSAGIYLARYFNGKQWRTEKIMVLP